MDGTSKPLELWTLNFKLETNKKKIWYLCCPISNYIPYNTTDLKTESRENQNLVEETIMPQDSQLTSNRQELKQYK